MTLMGCGVGEFWMVLGWILGSKRGILSEILYVHFAVSV